MSYPHSDSLLKKKSENQKLHSLLPFPPLPPVIQVIKS